MSEELIRVAILWHELWHEGLEEASRLYFGEGNVKGMFAVLEPLHQMMERGPQTLKETSFNQVRKQTRKENMNAETAGIHLVSCQIGLPVFETSCIKIEGSSARRA